MSTDFLNKVAVVTGSSSGIGQAIALHLAKRGASVTLCGRDVPRLEATKSQCVEASGGHSNRFLIVAGDATDEKVRHQTVESTVSTFGKLDILICNAGGAHPNSKLDNATEESFDFLMNMNVKAVFFFIQAALPHLEKSKGNIVIVSSMTSTLVSYPSILYATSKAAVDHMSRCLALDLAPRGIRVNTVNPSFTPTMIFRSPTGEYEEAHKMSAVRYSELEKPKQPLGNRLVTLDEIAEGALFLASGSASFITGQSLFIDGGRTLNGPYATINRQK